MSIVGTNGCTICGDHGCATVTCSKCSEAEELEKSSVVAAIQKIVVNAKV